MHGMFLVFSSVPLFLYQMVGIIECNIVAGQGECHFMKMLRYISIFVRGRTFDKCPDQDTYGYIDMTSTYIT